MVQLVDEMLLKSGLWPVVVTKHVPIRTLTGVEVELVSSWNPSLREGNDGSANIKKVAIHCNGGKGRIATLVVYCLLALQSRELSSSYAPVKETGLSRLSVVIEAITTVR